MFSQACVKNSVHRWGGGQARRTTPPPPLPPPPGGYYEMQSMSGRYAFYWNAFLYVDHFAPEIRFQIAIKNVIVCYTHNSMAKRSTHRQDVASCRGTHLRIKNANPARRTYPAAQKYSMPIPANTR